LDFLESWTSGIVIGSDYDNEQIATLQLPATAKPEENKLSSTQKHLSLHVYQ